MKKKLLCLTLILLSISYAYAVKVSPVRFDLSIPRGTTKEFVLNLSGDKGSKNQSLSIYPSDLFMNQSGALSFEIIKDSKNSAVKWIKMEKMKLAMYEGQEKKVKFKISIPSSAIPGEYYAVVMVEPETFTGAKDEKRHVMFQIKSRVAVVIVLDVPGRTYEKKGGAIGLKVIETDKLTKISSTFRNSGNIHLDVLGDVVVKSADGKVNFGKFELRALSSSKKDAFIFPGAMRDFEGFVGRQLPRGEYVAEVTYNYGYDFKKSKITQKFSIKRETSLNEADIEFLGVESKKLQLTIPVKATRTQIIKITNTDYRPISVSVVSNDWIKINPKSFNLKPGEVRSIQAVISVSEYKDNEPIKKACIILKANRGKSTTILVNVFKPGTPIPVEKIEEPQVVKDDQLQKEGELEKKFDEPQVVADSQLVVAEDSIKEITKVEDQNQSTNRAKDDNFILSLSKSDLTLYSVVGVAGLVILILLIIILRRKKGNSAEK